MSQLETGEGLRPVGPKGRSGRSVSPVIAETLELSDGVALSYTDHPVPIGSGRLPFVLVHGWMCDSGDWDPLLPWLTSRGRVVAVDLRGHGRSSRPGDGYTPSQLALDLTALLSHLGIDRCVLVGHSAGAEVAVTVAVARPDLVAALVSVDPAYGAAPGDVARLSQLVVDLGLRDGPEVASAYMARIDSPRTPPALAERHRTRPLAASPQVLQASFRDLTFGPSAFRIRPLTDDVLRRRDAPMLAVYRNAERAAVGRELATLADDVVHAYDGAGHWPHQEQPDRFASDVERWLSTTAVAQRIQHPHTDQERA